MATATDTRLFGKSIKRREDPRFITGRGNYTDDLKLPGMTYAAFVRSPHAHARVLSIDTAAASQAPTVRAALVTAGVPAPEQQRIVDGFTACLHDRLTANDPDVVPATCHGDQNAALASQGLRPIGRAFLFHGLKADTEITAKNMSSCQELIDGAVDS